jgi:hypothetical protein
VYANEALAPLFGVTGVAGPDLRPVEVDSTKRVGILPHPLVMATHATPETSHPILRGRFLWDQVLCQPVLPPMPATPLFIPGPGQSQRQAFETMTGTGPDLGKMPTVPGSDCPSCHSRMDPIGFLFEPFDTIGRYRTIDDYGQPVDLTHIAVVEAADPNLNMLTASSMDFATHLAASDTSTACLATQLYRYMARRYEAPADAPVQAWLDQTFVASAQNLTPLLVGLTQTDVFLNRVNSP